MKFKHLLTTFTLTTLLLLLGNVGWAQEITLYSTGFESSEGFTASTTYNNSTVAYTGPVDKQWGTYFGTPSTTGPITLLQSMQMRYYTSTPTSFGYTFTNFDLPKVSRVTFKAKDNANTADVIVSYSTDGGSTYVGDQTFVLSTTATSFEYSISPTGEFANVRIKFTLTGTAVAERLLIDDIVIYGIDNVTPSAIFDPASAATDVALNSNITITFDEAVRNIDDSDIDDTNVDALIILKKDNSSGADVAFDATIDAANKIVTINPTADFDFNQVYYVAIASVEDAAGNATGELNSTFTSRTASTNATVTSGVYTVTGNPTWTITNVPSAEVLATFEGNITPAAGATFDTYEADGTTTATDLQTGYKLIVTAEDGTTTNTYVITKNASLSTETDFTAYSLPSQTGAATIDAGNHTISIEVPCGTDVTALVATFTLSSGANAKVGGDAQTSATTPNDFTSPVTYTVTAEDGTTTQDWVVTVTFQDHLALTAPNGGTTYYAGDVIEATWTSCNMTDVKVEITTNGTDWTELIATTTAADGKENITIPADIYSTTCKVRITDLGTSGLSDVSDANFTIIPTVADLAALRSKTADNATLYKYTGTATITYARTSRNQKYIQDATGAMLIDDPSNFVGGSYVKGDGIKNVVGKLYNYSNLIEFIPVAATGEEVAGSVITPEVKTIASLTSADQCKLVKIVNYAFATTGQYATSNLFVASKNYDIVGYANTAFAYRTAFSESDYIGQTITTNPITTVGLVGQYNAAMQITARDLADIQSAVATVSSTVYTVNDGDGTITNVTYAHNLATFEGNITPATGATFETYQADGTTVAADLQTGYKLIVTAQDGTTTKTYTITRNAASTDATVTSGSYTVNSTDNTIINVPYNESLASFESKITPAAGASFETYLADGTTVAADLATGYKLICTAEDGTTKKTYTITKNSEPSHEANILTFSLDGSVGTPNSGDHTVAVTVPYGTNVTNLVATFTLSTNAIAKVATVAQTSGVTANDFSSPVTYDITAEDGTTTVNWVVTVTVTPASTDATVSSTVYTVDNGLETITNIPYNETLATFKGNITPATFAAFEVYQSNGTDVAADLQSGYKLIGTAQSGATKTYTITLNAAPPAELFFSEYIEGSSSNKALEIYNGTGSSVDLSVYSVKTFANGAATASYTLALTGTLADGATYVIGNAGAGTSIKNIANIESSVTYYNGDDAVGLYKNDVLIDVIGTIGADPGTAWDVAGTTGATLDHTLVRKDIIVVGTTDWAASSGTTAENSQWTVYALDNFDYIGWHKTKSSEKDILTFTLAAQTGDATIDNGAHTIAIEVANGTSVTALVPTITVSSRATISPLSGVAQDFTNPVVYTVTAQDGTTQTWTVTVTVAVSTDATVSTTASYIIDNGAGTITNIPYAHSLATFEGNITPAAGATFETYQANGTTVAADLQTGYKLIVTAQDGTTTKTYTITRIAPATVSSLSSLKYDATSVPSFDAATLTYNVAFPFGSTVIPVVTATATDANANVAITQATSITASEAERTATVVVTAEDGIAQTTYTVVFSVTPANTDNTLSDLKVESTTIPDFVSTTTSYTYELPIGTTATPAVTATTNHATATAVVTDATDVTSATAADRTTSVEVTAQDGSKKTYTIEFNVAAPGTDATLTGIKVDGVAIATFNALTLTYNVSLAANTTVVPTVSATTNDPLATAQITAATNLIGTLAERTTTIEVTAENTTTKKTYSVIFYVKSGDATLSDLKYNTTQVPSFDPATLTYNVELPYGSSIPTIDATKNFAGATVNVVNATNLKGTLAERTATITVTAEDVNISKVYTIVFTVIKSTDATLSDLQYDGTTVTGFDANIIKYFVTLPFGSSIPNVTATKNNADATIAITQVVDLSGDLAARTATVLVTAENGDTKTYSIVFRVDNTEKELFFSEYLIGSSNNKAFEIYNPSSSPVDLSLYTIKQSNNGYGFGKTSAGDNVGCVLPLSGTLAPGDVYVIYNTNADQAIKDKGDLVGPTYPAAGSNIASSNGNDALALYKGTTLIDVFGIEIATTPGSSAPNFDVAGVTGASQYHTIVRKPTVTKGNTDWTASAGTTAENSEWIVYPKDEFSYLGTHTMFLPVPTITTDKNTLPDFGNIVSGTVGAGEQSFSVGGVYLSSDIVITAPAGFEISTQTGANFVSSSPIALTPASGIVAPTTIYVKFHPAAIQAYSANITLENGEVTTMNVAVSGTGVETDVVAPSFISGYPALENVGPYTLDVKVKIDEAGFVYFHKVAKDATAPTADEIKAQGTMIDAAAANTEYTVNVTGLTDNTAYDFYFVVEDKQATPNVSSVELKQVTTAAIPVVTISDIQTPTTGTEDSQKLDQWVTTTGIVTFVKNGTSAQDGFYMQDAKGAWHGIYVYTTEPVSITESVTVTGKAVEFNAKTEISSVTKVVSNGTGNALYDPEVVTTQDANDEKYEAVLVKVTNAICQSGSSGSFVVSDGTGNLTVYKQLFAELALIATKKYDIVGILDDYKPTSGNKLYELYPRNLGDITEIIPEGIDDNFNSSLTVYPNPFTNEIRFDGAENVKRVVITSVTGQIIKNEAVDMNNFISTADLNKGMYIVTFINNKGEKAIKKMIKQ